VLMSRGLGLMQPKTNPNVDGDGRGVERVG